MISRPNLLICLALFALVPLDCAAFDELYPPTEYLHSKLQQYDIVFLGTKHRKPKILKFIAGLIPSLKGMGVTHIGLEIPSGQQERIDTYIQTGDGLNSIILHTQIDIPEFLKLLEVIRDSGGPSPVAIDLPYTRFGGSISRDEWMSRSLLQLLPGKILVVVGNRHIFKVLEWDEQVPKKNLAIRQYIQREKPEARMWSVGQVIDEDPNDCDFTEVFGQLPGSVALDLDDMVQGWRLGLTSKIAIMPAESFELVDGLIVY